MHPFELTRRLIDIESMTGNERAIALFLRDYLLDQGFEVILQEAASERLNVLAHYGSPLLALTTHLDTVPPFIPAREDDEFIHGRGACDAKGIIAAQIEAARALKASGETRLALLFVVGEERDSVGAIYANENPIGTRWFVDGEPTENRLAIGSKGSLRMEIAAGGKAAHSAYPHMGDSAILKLLDILQDLRRMEFRADPQLGKTTCNIGIIEGGSKPNVIAAHARAEVMFRSVEPLGGLKDRLEALVAGRAMIRFPFEVPIMRMNALEGFESTVVSFASDVPFLLRWGMPHLCGPGSILDAHTDQERISKRQLLEGVETYVRIARRLLSENA